MDVLFRNELNRICSASGFTQKGQSYFRLIGDGVLQVIKCKYERKLGGHIIYIGLFSMYSDLQPQWFTSSGCIPRYTIDNCYYQNNMPLVFAIPLQIQMEMLESQVIPWLDTIDTQKKLLKAILKLDPRWNDILKIGPYLVCGEHTHAKKVIREILSQNNFMITKEYHYVEDSNGLMFLKKEQEDVDIGVLLEMISRGATNEINSYLNKNYARNMVYAKFCM